MTTDSLSGVDVSTRSTRPRRRRRVALAVAAGLSLAMLASCGSSDGDADGVASVDDAAGGDSGPATSTAADPDAALADYEQCMRDEGVDLPDIDGGGGNAVDGEGESDFNLNDIDSETLNAAVEACAPLLDNVQNPLDGMSPEQQAAFDEFMAEMQTCLSDKGFDIPMPSGGGNAVDGEDIAGLTVPPDFDWDGFETASVECEEQVGVPDVLEEFATP